VLGRGYRLRCGRGILLGSLFGFGGARSLGGVWRRWIGVWAARRVPGLIGGVGGFDCEKRSDVARLSRVQRMWARRFMACSLMAVRRPGCRGGRSRQWDVALRRGVGLGSGSVCMGHFDLEKGSGPRAPTPHGLDFRGGRAGARLGRWGHPSTSSGQALSLRQADCGGV
jgi:hypothetical protein